MVTKKDKQEEKVNFKPNNKQKALITMIVAGVLLIVAIVIFAMLRANEDTWIKDNNGEWVMHGNPTIKDFDSCAKKYPVVETFPEQCSIPDGPTFTKDDIHLKY